MKIDNGVDVIKKSSKGFRFYLYSKDFVVQSHKHLDWGSFYS